MKWYAELMHNPKTALIPQPWKPAVKHTFIGISQDVFVHPEVRFPTLKRKVSYFEMADRFVHASSQI